jgi:outer membrane beta-barrel protein
VLASASALGAPSKKAPTPRDVEVDTVKDAYWNRTSDGDIEVVQNRQFSKKNRVSLAANFGTVSSDPFLTVYSTSAALSYHLTETFAVTGIYKKFIVSNSGYYNDLQTGLITGASSIANTNRPNSFAGGEIAWSPLYGKISLSGASIVHYDAHLLLGAGVTDTETGKDFTPSIGFGPQFYLSNNLAVRLDYRFAFYKETIPQKNPLITNPVAGDRTNYSHQVALGLEVFL